MRHHRLALAACIVLAGSIANAAPPHHAKHHAKVHKHKHVRPHTETREENDRVAFASPEPADPIDAADITIDDAPVKLHKRAVPRAHDWHLAIGPYLWASSVDANVSLGSASVSSGVDFLQTAQHARYGAELIADARLGRFTVSGDFMYGVVGIDGGNSVGPLMVKVAGTASSLLVDGAVGYRLAGDEHSLMSFEARAGIRYQRTEVAAAVDVDGSPVMQPQIVDAGRDVLAGARVFVRPSSRFYLSTTADVGVAGSSTSTWSVAADASLRVTSRVLLSAGWRTLSIERANLSMVMHGPRAALQFLF